MGNMLLSTTTEPLQTLIASPEQTLLPFLSLLVLTRERCVLPPQFLRTWTAKQTLLRFLDLLIQRVGNVSRSTTILNNLDRIPRANRFPLPQSAGITVDGVARNDITRHASIRHRQFTPQTTAHMNLRVQSCIRGNVCHNLSVSQGVLTHDRPPAKRPFLVPVHYA